MGLDRDHLRDSDSNIDNFGSFLAICRALFGPKISTVTALNTLKPVKNHIPKTISVLHNQSYIMWIGYGSFEWQWLEY